MGFQPLNQSRHPFGTLGANHAPKCRLPSTTTSRTSMNVEGGRMEPTAEISQLRQPLRPGIGAKVEGKSGYIPYMAGIYHLWIYNPVISGTYPSNVYVYLGLYKYIMSYNCHTYIYMYIYICIYIYIRRPQGTRGSAPEKQRKICEEQEKGSVKESRVSQDHLEGLHHIVLLSFLIIVNVIFDYPPTPGN